MLTQALMLYNPDSVLSAVAAQQISTQPHAYTLIAAVNAAVRDAALQGKSTATVTLYRNQSLSECKSYQYDDAVVYLTSEIVSRGYQSSLLFDKDGSDYLLQLKLSW